MVLWVCLEGFFGLVLDFLCVWFFLSVSFFVVVWVFFGCFYLFVLVVGFLFL